MTVLSVYAHHEPTSLTGALKNTAISVLQGQGHTVLESDLYATGFSAVAEKYDFTNTSGGHFNYMLEQQFSSRQDLGFAPDILAEIEKLSKADMVIFHAPVWWQGVPAILKGWFDRVLVMGAAWDGGKIYEKGLLRGKSAMLCLTVGGPREFYNVDGKHGATIEQILHPIQRGTLAFCGMDVLDPFVVYNSLGKTEQELAKDIKEYHFRVSNLATSPSFYIKY